MDNQFLTLMSAELMSAVVAHAPLNSAHEAYAVILEELDEFKAEVWKKKEERSRSKMLRELVQVATMCWRAAVNLNLTGPSDGIRAR